MGDGVHNWGRAAAPMLIAWLSALAGCSDDADAACRHDVCDIRDPSCVEFVAEVVACQREVPVVMPSVRFVTTDELLAEEEQPSQEQIDLERDYRAGEALMGLMPSDYEPAAAPDSFNGFIAFYFSEDDEIVILSDVVGDDEELAYRVMVHEMIHAHQDAEYDLPALFETHATSFPRSLGLRAAVEGEAVLYEVLAELDRTSVPATGVDWSGYFSGWQDDMLHEARVSETPSLDVTALFPYAFGGEQVYFAWTDRGLAGVRDYVQQPPDSVRQVMAGYAHRPPRVFNRDAELEPNAVPVLPDHTYLGGGGQGAWLLNTMLQRLAGSRPLWNDEVADIEADHLSVWRNDATGNRVAVWRLMGDSSRVQALLTGPASRWVESADEPRITRHIRNFDGDWVLVASETDTAVAVTDAITGWQSREQARASAGLMRRPSRREELVLRGCMHRAASPSTVSAGSG